jgi:hypothetical protein
VTGRWEYYGLSDQVQRVLAQDELAEVVLSTALQTQHHVVPAAPGARAAFEVDATSRTPAFRRGLRSSALMLEVLAPGEQITDFEASAKDPACRRKERESARRTRQEQRE